MGALVGAGFSLVIGATVGVIFTVISLFFGHIILFDSIALAIISGLLANGLLHLHPILCILIGIVALVLLFWLQNTKFGFWIIGGLLSLLWGFIFAVLAYDSFDGNMLYTYGIWALGALIIMGLHLRARNKETI